MLIKYTKTHEWVRWENEEATVGITEHAQKLLGDLVYVEFPTPGQSIEASEELGVVESVKAAADFYAPVSGIVTAVNTQVSDKPELINKDPYGEGWLIKMKMTRLEELESLLNEVDYQKEITED